MPRDRAIAMAAVIGAGVVPATLLPSSGSPLNNILMGIVLALTPAFNAFCILTAVSILVLPIPPFSVVWVWVFGALVNAAAYAFVTGVVLWLTKKGRTYTLIVAAAFVCWTAACLIYPWLSFPPLL